MPDNITDIITTKKSANKSTLYSGPVASVRIGLKYQSLFNYLLNSAYQSIQKNEDSPKVKQILDDMMHSLWLETEIISRFGIDKVYAGNNLSLKNVEVVLSTIGMTEQAKNIGSNHDTNTIIQIKLVADYLQATFPNLSAQFKQNLTILNKLKTNPTTSEVAKSKNKATKTAANDGSEILEEDNLDLEYQKLNQKYPKTDRVIYLISPTVIEQQESLLDLVISGNGSEIMMVECGANLIDEQIINRAIDLANLEIKKLIEIQQAFVQTLLSQS